MDTTDKLIEYNNLNEDFRKAQSSDKIEQLCQLIEFVRGEGIFYQDFPKQNFELYKRITEICFDCLKNTNIFSSDKYWFYIMEVYDIRFHQIPLENYPPICAKLYFQLSEEVLNEKFHKLYKFDDMHSYRMCIYFILMADGWFTNREQEFLAIYKK